MSNLIPMSGYPIPVRPYSQITPFTYRDNSTYLEILEQLRTWIQNTLVPSLDTQYAELVQSWADNIELLTTQYETLLSEYEAAHQGDLDAMATTLRGEFAAEDSDIRAEFRGADSNLNDQIVALAADLNAQIQDIINNSVAAQDSVVSQLILDAGSLTTAALNGTYATDLDIAAINTHLGTVDSHLTTLDGQITAVNSNATTLSGRVTATEGSISSINTHLTAIDSTNTTQNTAISTNATNIATNTTKIATNTSGIASLVTRATALETASPATVASAAERDARFPSPVQGNSVFRSDLGYIERYYGLFNSTTNYGGRTPAGWYGVQDGGLTPMIPKSVVITGGGTATVSANGLVSITSGYATSLLLESVFQPGCRKFKIILGYQGYTTAGQANYMKMATGTTPDPSNTTNTRGVAQVGANAPVAHTISSLGGFYVNQQAGYTTATMDILNPNSAGISTSATWSGYGFVGAETYYAASGIVGATTAFDGLQLTSTGSFSGFFQVFGYRD